MLVVEMMIKPIHELWVTSSARMVIASGVLALMIGQARGVQGGPPRPGRQIPILGGRRADATGPRQAFGSAAFGLGVVRRGSAPASWVASLMGNYLVTQGSIHFRIAQFKQLLKLLAGRQTRTSWALSTRLATAGGATRLQWEAPSLSLPLSLSLFLSLSLSLSLCGR